jgi:hypothetical protein
MKNGGWLDKYEAPEAQNGKELTPKEFTLQYINSPKYRERLTKSEYGDIDAEIKRRYDNVKNTNNIITQSGPSGVLDSFKGFVFNKPYNPTGGSNASSKNTIFYDPTEAKKIGSTKDETLSHEFSHKETMGDNDGTIFLNNRDIKELTGRLNPGAKKTMHDARADENKADMNAVRYWLYNNGVDVFNKDLTPEDLKKAKASGKFTSNRLFKNYKSDEDLLWLLNNVAKNKSNQEVRIAQNGIEGTMGGLTDVGFNYNGAWGGPSMAMGGSLPGSVGFTYARIQGSAPANGKYTKKTKASAQNGAEMSFYQNGLDWKPRNISRDGAWLDKYDDIPKAQMGTMTTPLDFSKPIGTLEGVSEVMSAPARTATYLLTGKYQDPSQALGIKNPWGALAADMVLDPVNLIGAGVATKAAKATKAATKALNPMKKAIDKAVVYSSELQYHPSFEEALDKGYLQAVKNMDKLSETNKALANNPWKFLPDEIKKYKIQNDLDEQMRTIHEIHPETITSLQELKPESVLFDNMSKRTLENFAGDVTSGTNWSSGINKYFSKLDMSKFKNEEEFLKDVRKKEYQEFLKKHPKDYKFSMTDLISLPKNKQGGEITKDDMGYWNPDNWGEPVEIGSNNITMQGVYEPLLGISDEGDTKMMYPGKDYKFKGKKVREYPISKNGGWLDKYK